uniref:Uncharacterized protein PF13_0277 n=1 Tax=Anthurium amnicola TaxID=1678845 RepID=A0A1D1ZE94_9ARAE
MAVSAFKSTSKRGNFAGPPGDASSARHRQSEDPGKGIPARRSRSVSAVSRSPQDAPAAMSEFLNKRDNPLFCDCPASVSPTDSEKSMSVVEKGSVHGSDCRRGRSASRSSGFRSEQSGHRQEWGRSLSRIDVGRRRRSVSRSHYGNPESHVQVSTWDDGASTSSFSEAEEKTIKAVFEQMKFTQPFQNEQPLSDSGSGIYETVRSEVRRAMSEIRSDLENAIHRRDISVTAMSNGVDASPELVKPDAVDLSTDISREYAQKLQQTQERARKLRADLDTEEQRSQELSRILKETLPDSKCSEMQKSRPRRKASIERHKMSTCLTEEAMNYFDECVSISTFDTSDFSSPEDQIPSSFDDNLSRGDDSSFENKDPSASSVCLSSDPLNHPEFCHTQSRISQFSFSRKPEESVGFYDIKHYVKKFGKELQAVDEHLNVRSSYYGDDYDLNVSDESLLLEKTMLRNRIESGCLLICDVRTF